MADLHTEQATNVNVPRVRDQQYRDVYSNSNLINLGPFDFTITFQKTMEIVPGQGGIVDLVSVSLSPQNFKGLVRVVTETLEAYERVFGALQIPDEDTAPMKNAAEVEAMLLEVKKQIQATKAGPSPNASKPPAKRSRDADPE